MNYPLIVDPISINTTHTVFIPIEAAASNHTSIISIKVSPSGVAENQKMSFDINAFLSQNLLWVTKCMKSVVKPVGINTVVFHYNMSFFY